MTAIPQDLQLTPEEKRAVRKGIQIPGYYTAEAKLRGIQKLLADEWYVDARNRLIPGAAEATNRALRNNPELIWAREFHKQMTIRAKKAGLTAWSK